MKIYPLVALNASSGAFSIFARAPAPNAMTAVRTIPITPNRRTPVPMVLPTSRVFPAPICCPITTVIPIAKPVIMFVIVCVICDPVETPETSDASAKCPTTIRSTAPYIACRNIAASTGSMNASSGLMIEPSVKLPVLLFCSALISVFPMILSFRVNRKNFQPSDCRNSRIIRGIPVMQAFLFCPII